MRKVKFFFAFLLAAGMLNASAQNSQEPIQTLLGDSPSLGGFIGFGGKMTTFNKQGGLMLGGELNMVLGRGMNLGFHGYGLVTETTSSNFDEFGKSLYYNIGYGGLTLEPVFFSEKAVHFTVPILLGGGGIGESRYPLVDGDNSDYEDFPGFYRTVFTLYVFEDYSHKEIGEVLGVSESTSKSQLNRARKRVAEWLITNGNGKG